MEKHFLEVLHAEQSILAEMSCGLSVSTMLVE